jgi:hypothetical protein
LITQAIFRGIRLSQLQDLLDIFARGEEEVTTMLELMKQTINSIFRQINS